MSDLSLRPGVALGPYPERQEPGVGVLERIAARAEGIVRQRTDTGARRFRHVVKRVEQHGLALRGRSDAKLQVYARELRAHLRRRGLMDELVVRAFALVREVAERELGMRHFDVQIVGGWAIVNGMLAEMETGEGKTLTATLPACAAALAGIPVHVVTVNDYLVTRDAEWMRPVYEALGLTVGTITEEMDPETRRASYACDVTYCTNKQLAFDYLKDRLVLGNAPGRLRLEMESLYSDAPRLGRLLLRGLCFAIVDEADSVLVDEARTPLIISRPGDTEGQREVYEQALALAERLEDGVDYEIEPRDRNIRFNHRGTFKLAQMTGDLGGLWTGRKRREELVRQALSAQHLFVRDQQYLVRDGKALIIDEYTGRVMPDRSWERGLHQMIETKEGLEITGQKDTLARISYQRFFRRYLRLGGMTGTAREVAAELWSVYRLKVVTVPPNRDVRRRRRPDRLFHSSEAKWSAVVDTIGELHAKRRPVLVGTRSVEASEHLSTLLDAAGLPHQVLNARQDQEEAGVVERAGELRRITVATNMAGRGTDIRLAPGVQTLGGLHVIATERHDARRIDRQLYGRCARQGDRGSIETLVSCEDELFQVYCPTLLALMLRRLVPNRRPLLGWFARMIARIPQRSAERRHARTRRQLLEMDERLGDALAFSGRSE
jgi:preprotein translocase subunit SecA